MNENYCKKVFDICEMNLPNPIMGSSKNTTTKEPMDLNLSNNSTENDMITEDSSQSKYPNT